MSAILVKNVPNGVRAKQGLLAPVGIGGGVLTISEIDAAKRAGRIDGAIDRPALRKTEP